MTTLFIRNEFLSVPVSHIRPCVFLPSDGVEGVSLVFGGPSPPPTFGMGSDKKIKIIFSKIFFFFTWQIYFYLLSGWSVYCVLVCPRCGGWCPSSSPADQTKEFLKINFYFTLEFTQISKSPKGSMWLLLGLFLKDK